VDLDAKTAAAIAAGMRKVAVADGEALHPNELSLIAEFEKDLPDGTPATSVAIWDAQVRSVYLKSLVMVALADGQISDTERAVIEDLALGVGADQADVVSAMNDVKQEFLAVFSGVTHFRDQVEQVAEELGVELD
jgi:uncharacterized membrane protein YebE (DUF533 family)